MYGCHFTVTTAVSQESTRSYHLPSFRVPSLSASRPTALWLCSRWPIVSGSWEWQWPSARGLWLWPWRTLATGGRTRCLLRCQRGKVCWRTQAWWRTHRSCSKRPMRRALSRPPESLTAGTCVAQLSFGFSSATVTTFSLCVFSSRLVKAIENLQCFSLAADPSFRHFHLDATKEVKLIGGLEFIHGELLGVCAATRRFFRQLDVNSIVLLLSLLRSSTGSSYWHSEDISLWPAVSVLAPPSELGPSLALLRWISATCRGSWSHMGRHQIPQCLDNVAAAGWSEGDQRCGGPTADGQRVRAQGERLQQGRVWRVQWGSLPPHSTGTWWDLQYHMTLIISFTSWILYLALECTDNIFWNVQFVFTIVTVIYNV